MTDSGNATVMDADSPWKEALERYFEAFMEFFFPAIHSAIDWAKGYEFLDKEREKVVRDAALGRRYADKLVKVFLSEGMEAWLLIHLEIQGYFEVAFEKRMFIYYYRIFDRYGVDVISLAVLTDEDPSYRPNVYKRSHFECELTFRFPVIKLIDYRNNLQLLETSNNPFSKVVLAHLKARELKDDQERKLWKVRLVRMLYDASFSRQDILELFRFIDWLLVLPQELEKEFMEEIIKFEEERHMPYITSVEKRGIQQGLYTGSLQEAREALMEVIETRFNLMPEKIVVEIKKIESKEALRSLLRNAIRCEDLDEFQNILKRVRSSFQQ